MWWKASRPHLQQLVRQERRTLATVAADGRTPTYRHDGAVLATTATATTLPCPDAAVSAVWLRILTAYETIGHQAATGQFVTSAETTAIYQGLLDLEAALMRAGLVFRSN